MVEPDVALLVYDVRIAGKRDWLDLYLYIIFRSGLDSFISSMFHRNTAIVHSAFRFVDDWLCYMSRATGDVQSRHLFLGILLTSE